MWACLLCLHLHSTAVCNCNQAWHCGDTLRGVREPDAQRPPCLAPAQQSSALSWAPSALGQLHQEIQALSPALGCLHLPHLQVMQAWDCWIGKGIPDSLLHSLRWQPAIPSLASQNFGFCYQRHMPSLTIHKM